MKKEIIIPFIEGDGIGPEITKSMIQILDKAFENTDVSIKWIEIYAGQKAIEVMGNILPDETLDIIRKYKIAIKGPIATPVAGGYRSINVALRQLLDLYACIRPVKWIEGTPAPVKYPEKLDIVIFRENTEDLYAGIEWENNSDEVKKIMEFLNRNFGIKIRQDSGIGIKPISYYSTSRVVRKAIKYAIENDRKRVTIVHKGNIMKYTEGAFRNWAYDIAKNEFFDFITFDNPRSDKIFINDIIADNMFQQLLINPDKFDIIVTTNLNGDYLSDAAAAQIGGLGIAPGANMSDDIALFEATHGIAPDIAGKNLANPTSLLLSACLMLEHIGLQKYAEKVKKAIFRVYKNGLFTKDISQDNSYLTTDVFTEKIIEYLNRYTEE